MHHLCGLSANFSLEKSSTYSQSLYTNLNVQEITYMGDEMRNGQHAFVNPQEFASMGNEILRGRPGSLNVDGFYGFFAAQILISTCHVVRPDDSKRLYTFRNKMPCVSQKK
mmetsp:Transcript_36114/g.58201  ORF Transcript_36114/g.58201 Transcript_36114/m.58201 type:complete len:111 (-) Transcript_36114:2-334(-)